MGIKYLSIDPNIFDEGKTTKESCRLGPPMIMNCDHYEESLLLFLLSPQPFLRNNDDGRAICKGQAIKDQKEKVDKTKRQRLESRI